MDGMEEQAELEGFAPGDPISELYSKHARSQQPESRQVVSVLGAVAEILRQEEIPPSPTSTFAAVGRRWRKLDPGLKAPGFKV